MNMPRSVLVRMSLEGDGRLLEPQTSKTLIYISQRVASDSAFPFKAGDALWIRIDPQNERLIVEKAKGRK